MKTQQVPQRSHCAYVNCHIGNASLTEVKPAPSIPTLTDEEQDRINAALKDYTGRAAFGVPLELLAHVIRKVTG